MGLADLSRRVTRTSILSRLSGEFSLVVVLGLAALAAGGFSGISLLKAFGDYPGGYSPGQVGIIGLAFGLGGLTAIIAAVFVDRKGPYLVLPVGAVVVAIGMAAAGFAGGLHWMAVVAAPVGAGTAAIGATMLIAVAAKGCIRIRGTAIGVISLLGGVGAMPLTLGPITASVGPHTAGFAAAAAFTVLAVVLYTKLPSVFPPRAETISVHRWRLSAIDESQANIKALIKQWAFWRAVVLVGMVMGLSRGVVLPARLFRIPVGADPLEVLGIEVMDSVAFGFCALLWGIASDRVPVKGLMLIAAGIAIVSAGGLALGSAWSDPLALVMLAIVGGAAIVLPWVMLADYVGTRYMATVGLILVASPLNGALSALSMIATGYLLNWGVAWGVPLSIFLFAIAVVLVVGVLRPLRHASKVNLV